MHICTFLSPRLYHRQCNFSDNFGLFSCVETIKISRNDDWKIASFGARKKAWQKNPPIFSNLCILMPSEELNYSWLVNWADYHFFVPQIEADNSNLCVRRKGFEGYKNILSGEIFSNFE